MLAKSVFNLGKLEFYLLSFGHIII